ETGLEAIDVSVLASLNSSVVSLSAAAETSLANATTGYNEMPTVFASHYLVAVRSAVPHVEAIKAAVAAGAPPLTLSALATLHTHADSVIAVLRAYKSRAEANDEPVIDGGGMRAVDAASSLKALTELAIDTVGTAVRYELTG